MRVVGLLLLLAAPVPPVVAPGAANPTHAWSALLAAPLAGLGVALLLAGRRLKHGE